MEVVPSQVATYRGYFDTFTSIRIVSTWLVILVPGTFSCVE